MSFAMTEEQRMAVDGLRRYLDDVIEPEFLEHGDGFIPREKMQKWIAEPGGIRLDQCAATKRSGAAWRWTG